MKGPRGRMGKHTFLGLVLFVGAIVLAQVASAAGTSTPTADAPPPELCAAQAPSFSHISQIMATPQALASPVASPPTDAPPASPNEIAAVTGLVRELIACFNAGEPLKAYGLDTDAYLRHLFAVNGTPAASGYNVNATPERSHPDRY